MNLAERDRLLRTFIVMLLEHLDHAPALLVSVRVQLHHLISDTHWDGLDAEAQVKLSDLIEDAITLYQRGDASAEDTANLILIAAGPAKPES
jgi:hypothetical protein